MNLRTLLVSSAVLGLLAAGEASAQKLSLRIDKGVVTLDADNVTVDEVLARWTAATGLNVVSKNGRGSEVPLTLHLEGVSEREALETVLRDLSGYIMGERRDPQSGVVTIDRLMILPDSAPQAPAVAATRGRRAPARAATEIAIPPAEPVFVVEDPRAAVELAPATPGRTTAATPPGFALTGDGTAEAPPAIDVAEALRTLRPQTPPAPSATPGNPFGSSIGAARPGQMTPAPAPPQQEPPITNPDFDPRATGTPPSEPPR